MYRFSVFLLVMIAAGITSSIRRGQSPMLVSVNQTSQEQRTNTAWKRMLPLQRARSVKSRIATKQQLPTKPSKPDPTGGGRKRTNTAANSRDATVERETHTNVPTAAHIDVSRTDFMIEMGDRLVTDIQHELIRLGCLEGASGGIWDEKTQTAVVALAFRAKSPGTGRPSREFLAALRGYGDNFCKPGKQDCQRNDLGKCVTATAASIQTETKSGSGNIDAQVPARSNTQSQEADPYFYLPPWQRPRKEAIDVANISLASKKSAPSNEKSAKFTGTHRSRGKILRENSQRNDWTPAGWPRN